jgi:hypothetical protein
MDTHKVINKSASEPRAHSMTYELRISIWCGLLVSAALIGFFLVMKFAGLHRYLALRYFNWIIYALGIIIAFSVYSRNNTKHVKHRLQYLKGIKMGLRIALIAIIPFAIFMFVYLRIDESFMIYIRENSEFGRYLSPISAAAVVAIEGFVGGAITTYMAMQYFKDNAT